MRCAKGDDRQTEEGDVWKVGRTDGWADWRDRVANTPTALQLQEPQACFVGTERGKASPTPSRSMIIVSTKWRRQRRHTTSSFYNTEDAERIPRGGGNVRGDRVRDRIYSETLNLGGWEERRAKRRGEGVGIRSLRARACGWLAGWMDG